MYDVVLDHRFQKTDPRPYAGTWTQNSPTNPACQNRQRFRNFSPRPCAGSWSQNSATDPACQNQQRFQTLKNSSRSSLQDILPGTVHFLQMFQTNSRCFPNEYQGQRTQVHCEHLVHTYLSVDLHTGLIGRLTEAKKEKNANVFEYAK